MATTINLREINIDDQDGSNKIPSHKGIEQYFTGVFSAENKTLANVKECVDYIGYEEESQKIICDKYGSNDTQSRKEIEKNFNVVFLS